MAAEAKESKDDLKELVGDKFLRVKGDSFETLCHEECIKGCDLVGLYFSAHWCPVK